MAQEKTLYNAAANGTGATYDSGAGGGANKLNVTWKVPRTVTAFTVTINSSPDNSAFTAVGVFTNVTEASLELELLATHRYYNCVITNYAGSGTIRVLGAAGENKENA